MRMAWNQVRKGVAGVSLAALSLISVSSLFAQNSARSQTVYLPDPTPRPKDPDLVYNHNQDDQPRVDSKAIQDVNTKRRELVEWAAKELITLSDRLEVEVRQPQSADSLAAAKANADKIEKLAKNLTDALKAP